MASVTLQQLHQQSAQKKFPRFKTGQTVKVHQKITEGEKERIQIFQGLIIEVSGSGVSLMITVRRIVDGIGVEKVFPVQSPFIEKIELVKEAKVRRSRIFFMRERSGKSARLQEKFYSDAELRAMMPHEVTEAELAEAVEHEQEEQKKNDEATTEETATSEEKDAA